MAHRATQTMHKDLLTGLHARRMHHHPVRGVPIQHGGRRLFRIDPGGNRHEVFFRHVGKLRFGSVDRETGHAITALEFAASGPVLVHATDEAVARRERWLFLKRVSAATHVDVRS